ncbi:hypothetical protein LZ496_08920 [Sphingomonas sp. NSE70-1]|uniref:MetA-pathway of phenol degradation n=1 Tax=Sphingomonas caseinilyticus TaxID=2908205 RepID=A0ABT0RV44_9SPHN|nr:hypothetical protein [Sphingomonas caseinilyticus]MCL6698900.1 hypothetical protein [Sphingomonas caseinilyticus]
MSKSIRFLGLAIFAWAGVRAISLGIVPGAKALEFDTSSARRASLLPPIEPTVLPAIQPVAMGGGAYWPGTTPAAPAPYPAYATNAGLVPYPVYVPVNAGAARSEPPQIFYVNPYPGQPRDNMVQHEVMAGPGVAPDLAFRPTVQATPSFEPPTRTRGLKQLSVTGWAMMRSHGGPDSLAGRGMLGGSEAGARLMWNFTPRIAATLRSSAPVNSKRGAEAALGVRYQPFAAWPVAVTLERRHAVKQYGRNAFAALAEGGVYGRPMPWQSTLDGYVQAGVVDFNNPDWFVDGQVAVSRPLWRNLSAGIGAWGGAQPGINRLDVGPRLSMRVGQRMRAHLDYRLNVAGNAAPGSGAVVTLAGDF